MSLKGRKAQGRIITYLWLHSGPSLYLKSRRTKKTTILHEKRKKTGHLPRLDRGLFSVLDQPEAPDLAKELAGLGKIVDNESKERSPIKAEDMACLS